jgi:ADP-ribosylglycohydrolase
MTERSDAILANILARRIRELGFESIRKFHIAHRDRIDTSYELLRQIIQTGRVPRPESLLPILHAALLPPSAIRNLTARLYPELGTRVSIGDPTVSAPVGGPETPQGIPPVPDPTGPAALPGLNARTPDEISRSLCASLGRLPLAGNEDLWEMAISLAGMAERKVRERARGRVEQPMLFGKEPEATYQFLVRRAKIVPFMSRGEEITFEPSSSIDYADRFRGALLGHALGSTMGAQSQGLSREDVRMLYGRITMPPAPPSTPRRPGLAERIAGSIPDNRSLDPESLAGMIADDLQGKDCTDGDRRFAANFREMRYPWFESGESTAESVAAWRCVPLALRNAGNFRRLKLEAGLCAAITHPNPLSVAGAILMAYSIARFLHTPSGMIDPIQFARGCAPVVTGIESDRTGGRARALPSLSRKVGTELPALLLRRASADEIARTVGNGESPQEGIPLALACVLTNPGDFREALLSAVNAGGDAIRIGGISGALAGALMGASAIPPEWRERVDLPGTLESAADSLLAASECPRRGDYS